MTEFRVLEVPDYEPRFMPTRRVVAEWFSKFRSVEDGKYGGITLGAYRRGKTFPTIDGAVVDVWIACARTENATGVEWPHVFFMTTRGRRGVAEDASIMCPTCREELKRNPPAVAAAKSKKPTNQMSLF